jgi:hypothetical protein
VFHLCWFVHLKHLSISNACPSPLKRLRDVGKATQRYTSRQLRCSFELNRLSLKEGRFLLLSLFVSLHILFTPCPKLLWVFPLRLSFRESNLVAMGVF